MVVVLPLPLWPSTPDDLAFVDREIDVEHDLLAAVSGLQLVDAEDDLSATDRPVRQGSQDVPK